MQEMFGRLQTSCHIQTQPEQLVITCTHSCRRFLVGTGAQVSVISAIWMNKRVISTFQPLQADNGTLILTFGVLIVPLHFGGRRPLLCTSHTS